ncbi:MAG: three-Cys-motif partner protein TcmP [Chloroflexi bacterium]|nr:three-Cys-motif partner protein TcmP [Chloroflexota bacterium]
MPRPVGDWTLDKLKILSQYLPGYLGATTKALERIYIDAFAGPGQAFLRDSEKLVPGSPLIALEARALNGTRFDRLFFIEKDYTACEELRAILLERDSDHRATVINGDSNAELPRLLKTLSRKSPIFVFVDPVGIDPRWETVTALAGWRTELLINFPLGMAMKRNYSSDKIGAYFGTQEAYRIWEHGGSGRTRALLDLYKSRLGGLGYPFAVSDDRLVKTEGNQALYYLMFVSKVDVAKTIMTWVFRQPNAAGQAQLPLQ